MNSITGRSPAIAAPTPSPAKPSSVIGVSTTRISPNSSSMPFDTLYAPLYSPTSSPIRKTLGSRSISSDIAWLSASRYVITAMSPLQAVLAIEEQAAALVLYAIDIRVQLLDAWLWRLIRELRCILAFGLNPFIDRL